MKKIMGVFFFLFFLGGAGGIEQGTCSWPKGIICMAIGAVGVYELLRSEEYV